MKWGRRLAASVNEPTGLIERSINDIKGLHTRFANCISRVTAQLEDLENTAEQKDLKFEAVYWRQVGYRNALIKLRLLIEQNFHYIETLSVLSVARYIFEILVWLKLLESENRYALVMYYEIIRLTVQHAEEQIRKIEEEIQLFEQLDDVEREMVRDSARSKPSASNAGFIMGEIDRRARRAFSIYADQAKHNGYSFQAYLMRQQALPRAQEYLKTVIQEKELFFANCSTDMRRLIKTRWNWKDQARKVSMQAQYEFIYSYTSRLLHATPVSFITDQKNLELPEMKIFLEYIYVSLLDAVEIAERRFGISSAH